MNSTSKIIEVAAALMKSACQYVDSPSATRVETARLEALRDAVQALREPVQLAAPAVSEHVAYLRYAHKHEGPTRILLSDSDEPGAFKVYRAAPLAPAQAAGKEPVSFRAKPLEWDQDSASCWTDKHHGFAILFEPGDAEPYSAAWAEGDSDSFTTLDAAKAWCQSKLDAWVQSFVVVAEPIAQQAPREPVKQRKTHEYTMNETTVVSTNHPLVAAWERHKSTESYANAFQWAQYQADRDGALWTTFVAGYEAAKAEPVAPAAPQAAPATVAALTQKLRARYGQRITVTNAGIITGEHFDFTRHPLIREAIAVLEKTAPTPQSAPLVVTDAMVEAYLSANAEYWGRLDGLLQGASGHESVRVSLQAALAAAEREQPAGHSR